MDAGYFLIRSDGKRHAAQPAAIFTIASLARLRQSVLCNKMVRDVWFSDGPKLFLGDLFVDSSAWQRFNLVLLCFLWYP